MIEYLYIALAVTPFVLIAFVTKKGIRCAHQYKCIDKKGNIDNKNPTVAKCVKCGQEINIEE